MVAQMLGNVESLKLQFPMQVRVMTKRETKEYHLRKLFELSKESIHQKPELGEPTDEQKQWIERRMNGPSWTWERWDGMIEEWTPWNSFGKWIDQWRYFKK